MSKKLGEYIKAVKAMNPVDQTAGSGIDTSIIIDRLGFEDGVLVVQTGAISGSPTAVTLTGKLTHGDAADLADGADFLTGLSFTATANTATETSVDLAGAKRYVKFVPTLAFTGGSTPKIVVGASLVLGNPRELPQ